VKPLIRLHDRLARPQIVESTFEPHRRYDVETPFDHHHRAQQWRRVGHDFCHERRQVFLASEEHLAFIGEVPEARWRGQPGASGDLRHGRLGESQLHEQFECERWHTEQLLLNSGLDATVIRPGFVVGVGVRGFDTVVSNAKRPVAVSMGGDRPRMRTIAVSDLVYELVGVLDEPLAYGKCFDVGNDEVLSINELTDITADVLGRRRPLKTKAPMGLMAVCAPLIEHVSKMSGGAVKGLVDGLKVDSIGDPTPIRTLLPRPLLSFRAKQSDKR
jgi:hypothetical protein